MSDDGRNTYVRIALAAIVMGICYSFVISASAAGANLIALTAAVGATVTGIWLGMQLASAADSGSQGQ